MSLFDQFRKNKATGFKSEGQKVGKPADILFLLQFDGETAYVEAADQNRKKISTDYRHYSGTVRSILKWIEEIQDKTAYTIDWENPQSYIYLHEHPYLIAPLLQSGLLVDKKNTPITAHNSLASLIVDIAPHDGHLMATTTLEFDNIAEKNFLFITDSYALLEDEHKIIETHATGPQYASINAFDTKLQKDDLQKYLSLLYSMVSNVNIRYDNYTLIHSDEKIKAQPLLIFEKIDADNALYMRVGQRLPNADVSLLEEFELYRFATINEIEQQITIREVEQHQLDTHISTIEKRLEKHAGKGSKKRSNGIVLENDLFIVPEEVASAFIYNEVPDLITEFAIVGSEKLKQYRINATPPRLRLNMSHGIDFLEGDVSLDFGDERISLFDAINQYNKNRYILLSNGDHAMVNEAYMQKLQRLFKKKKEKAQISFFDLPLVEELIDEKTAAEQFKKSRSLFEGFNDLKKQKVKLPTVNAKLRDYQVQGYKWLTYLHKHQLGGCLADDMGLGKTLQAITLLAGIYAQGKGLPPSLIVMPRSLLFNWDNEVQRFAPALQTYTYYGTTRVLDDAMGANLIFTTYALMRNDIEQFKEQKFYYVILDESQNIKNMQTQAARAVMLLDGKHRLALSGTPIENSLSELYSLFRFLNPAMFGSAEAFTQQYITPIQKHDDKTATADLRRKIYPFILRRLKKDVLTELPDKIEQTLYVEMNDEQAKYYEQRRQFYKAAIEQQVAQKGIQQAQFFIFQAMNELRQIASIPGAQTSGRIASPKAELLVEQIMDAVANNHKVLVFANFLHAIEQICENLDEQGIDFVTMTGSTRNRQEVVDRFQNNASCKVFLMTLKTGGTGLNLTAADIVFIFDPWWNKAAENQAIDRAHRMGQQNKVLSYRLIARNTIEEKILLLQEKKSMLFENVIAEDSASLKSMSQEDINFILGN